MYEQAVNVAALPGIVKASYAMPDAHWGYGFPIGGVAEVIDSLVRPEVEQLPVLDGRRLIGLLGREEPAKWLSLRMPRRSGSARTRGEALDLRV